MTKAKLETQLKMADEANKEALDSLRWVMYALKESNFGTAESRCYNGIQRLQAVLKANAELLGD